LAPDATRWLSFMAHGKPNLLLSTWQMAPALLLAPLSVAVQAAHWPGLPPPNSLVQLETEKPRSSTQRPLSHGEASRCHTPVISRSRRTAAASPSAPGRPGLYFRWTMRLGDSVGQRGADRFRTRDSTALSCLSR
jgi:hypothetical protein